MTAQRGVAMAFTLLALWLAPAAGARVSASPEKPYSNHLAGSASPYLLQHAHNPVDWYPWGPAALALAKRENRPIFLSIGYSTCHWCHVMAHESFENTQIAQLLNAHFVAIKMDREEHPDLDATFMIATQIVTGQGGWPNSLFLTPDGKPFYAGTYFPRPALASLLQQIIHQWQADPAPIRADGQKLAEVIAQVQARHSAAAAIDDTQLAHAAQQIMLSADRHNGGFGGAPKFPQEPALEFLLSAARISQDASARAHVLHTLDAMMAGGVHDQIGGGFHRYAVDRAWRVPHFEKMLYGQSQMAHLLVRACETTAAKRYGAALRDTLDYVLADLTSPQGGFYAARDADSAGEEGAFYVWTPARFAAILGPKDAAFAGKWLGVTPGGNFEGGRSVPYLAKGAWPADAGQRQRLVRIREKLKTARAQRQPPHRDEKIITAWNGLMIQALAEAALALDDAAYAKAAHRAGAFVWRHLRKSDGAMMRASFAGKTPVPGTQKDYAAAALGFVALYDLDGDGRWLKRAQESAAQMQKRFADTQTGEFYFSENAGPFGRPKSVDDSPSPSGNALALELYARLAARSADPQYGQMAQRLAAALGGAALQYASSRPHTLYAVNLLHHGETGPLRYGADGHVRALMRVHEDQVRVDLHMAPGWHINARHPLEDYLAPTELVLAGADGKALAGAGARYPEAVRQKLHFSKTPLAVYAGKVRVSMSLAGAARAARLRLQACDDHHCLAPQTLVFGLPPTAAKP